MTDSSTFAPYQFAHGRRARYVRGCRCELCRKSNALYYHRRRRLPWNGLVSAAPARRHLRRLSRQGVGYKAAAEAAGVGKTTCSRILNGSKRQIRKAHADAILAVRRDSAADHAVVDAALTWKMLNVLIVEYFSKAEVARQLGYKRAALQMGKHHVLAKTERKVRQLYRQAVGSEAEY